jgi:hypothetical protein
MNMQLSSLLSRFSEPETLKMAKLGRELRAKGIDIIDLSLGEPDFDTPQQLMRTGAIIHLSPVLQTFGKRFAANSKGTIILITSLKILLLLRVPNRAWPMRY